MKKGKARFTGQMLMDMGLQEVAPGKYEKKTDNLPVSITEKKDNHLVTIKDTLLTISQMGHVDQFVNNMKQGHFNRKEPFDIVSIRSKSEKDKKTDKAVLHEFAKTLVTYELGHLDCYIPGEVFSSKNSKQIGRFKKKDSDGNLQSFSTLRKSSAALKYEKQTKLDWINNRLKFKNATAGLKSPLFISFTFIRAELGRFDFQNMIQLPLDLMVANGWLEDDESACVVPVFNPVVYYSKYYAGLVIKVL